MMTDVRIQAVLLAMVFTVPAFADETVDIGTQRELFVDHHLIDELDDLRLTLAVPQPADVALSFDRPYEGAFSGYVTVIHDGGTYRMYYRGLPEARGDGSSSEVTCYAESPDGIVWTKPELGLYTLNGSEANNVILADAAPFSHNFSPFLDARPGVDAEERYKAFAGTSRTGLHAFVSGDGIRWRPFGDGPRITDGAFDSQNVAFWSAHEGMYICYFRTWSEGSFRGYRTISRATSEDFVSWTEPEAMTFGATTPEQLYTNQTQPYFRAPQVYIALPMRFVPGRAALSAAQAEALSVHPSYAGDAADAVFMTSRGGTAYDRTFMEAFIRPGSDPGNWASRAGMAALGVVPTGPAEMSLYKQAHYAQPSAHLSRYTLRTDGFASIRGGYESGTMRTMPLIHGGAALCVNFSTSAAGHVRVELQSKDGEVIPGHAFDDHDLLVGDAMDREVTWNQSAALPDVSPIRIRVELKDADLFALQFK